MYFAMLHIALRFIYNLSMKSELIAFMSILFLLSQTWKPYNINSKNTSQHFTSTGHESYNIDDDSKRINNSQGKALQKMNFTFVLKDKKVSW